jgi:N-acyl-D-amino-acid deacylase
MYKHLIIPKVSPKIYLFLFCCVLLSFCANRPNVQGYIKESYDLIIRNAIIYDGSGTPGVIGDLAVDGDTISAIGDLSFAKGGQELDAEGNALSPGFINMLSWANTSLIRDGKSQSDIRQGVTLEVMGEGVSMGPIKPRESRKYAEDFALAPSERWITLGGYLQFLENRGVATNVASMVGATSVRIHEVGYENRHATEDELERMKKLVAHSMREGAMGLGTALIYAPATYAPSEELIELAKVASSYGGIYSTHMRSEGNAIFSALEETFMIAREADIHTEIYHLKISGEKNWPLMDSIINTIQKARDSMQQCLHGARKEDMLSGLKD